MAGKYCDIRAGTRGNKYSGGKSTRAGYAAGGRVEASRQGAKTVINVVVPPSTGNVAAPSGPAAAPMPSAPAPAPVPPQAAAMALGQMQGKPGMPGAFARGGRVKGGAEGGLGRLQKAAAAKAARGK